MNEETNNLIKTKRRGEKEERCTKNGITLESKKEMGQ